MGPKRYRPPACTIQELPDVIDAVVISHTHYDHMDTQSIKDLHKRYALHLLCSIFGGIIIIVCNSQIELSTITTYRYGSNLHWYVPSDSGSFFTGVGIESDNVHEMVWWQEADLKPNEARLNNTKIVFTPNNHWGRRGIFDENTAL